MILLSIVKKESNIETNINKEITINTQFGERNIGLFKSNINGDTFNNFIQVKQPYKNVGLFCVHKIITYKNNFRKR